MKRVGEPIPSRRLRRLGVANVLVGLFHVAQALLIVLIANDFAIPVTAVFQNGPPGQGAFSAREELFSVPFGYAIAVFLGLAAVDHLLVGLPPLRRWYERNLARGVNYARWIEYSLSASVMIVLIAMLTGITSVFALVPIFGVNAAMILFGALMERINTRRDGVDWLPYLFGCIAGIVPWITVAIAIGGAEADGGEVPTFVFAIFIALFVFFNSFAVNQLLQYRKAGPWRDYLFGEWTYIVLSVSAKSVLAWQIFGGTLSS
jgi:hypothetical protein